MLTGLVKLTKIYVLVWYETLKLYLLYDIYVRDYLVEALTIASYFALFLLIYLSVEILVQI